MELASIIDVAALAPGTDRAAVREACRAARDLGCAAVCVAPAWVEEAAKQLHGSTVAVCGVVGFPLGATTPLVKTFEALECMKRGASDLLAARGRRALTTRRHLCDCVTELVDQERLLR